MFDDTAFLRQLTDCPDDPDTPLVYADWLDDAGDSPRADFLRLNHRMLGMRYRQKGFSEGCELLVRTGRNFDAAWLAVVSRPRVVGTCWVGADSRGTPYVWRFPQPGVSNYTSGSGTYQNGTWRQFGNVIVMETNRHYADYRCYIGGEWMHGRASNITGYHWRFAFRLTTDPAHTQYDHIDTTIYDSHLRGNPRRAKRKL